jgi:Icc-related predicted phosphoesterase
MRILCVADHVDPLVYSSSVKERFGDVDLVLAAGDLPMDYLGFLSGSLNRPVVFVFGNHNTEALDFFRRGRRRTRIVDAEQLGRIPTTWGSTYVGDRLERVCGLRILGFGGSHRYNRGENQWTQAQMWWKVLKHVPRLLLLRLFRRHPVDILLTHSPPFGIGDRPDAPHTGFTAFLWFLRVFRPRYMIHGHVHLYDLNAQRSRTYADTRIVNAYDHVVLELPEPEGARVRSE